MNDQPLSSAPPPNVQNSSPNHPTTTPGEEVAKESTPLGKYLLVTLGAILLVSATAGVTYWFMNRSEGLGTEEESDGSTRVNDEDNKTAADENVTDETENEISVQTVTMSFEGPTGTDTYEISFDVPEGDVEVVEPISGEYPAASYLDGGTYFIQVVHPTEVPQKHYDSVSERDIVNASHDLGVVYYFPIDLSKVAADVFPAVSSSTHVAYGAANEVSNEEECGGDAMSLPYDPPCGFPGILGDWSDPATSWPFLTITCIFEKDHEDLGICDDALSSLLVTYTKL